MTHIEWNFPRHPDRRLFFLTQLQKKEKEVFLKDSRGEINDKGLADEQRGKSKGGMGPSVLIKATKGGGRCIISALAAAAGVPVLCQPEFHEE